MFRFSTDNLHYVLEQKQNFFVKVKVFPVTSLSGFVFMAKMWLYNGAKLRWSRDHIHDWASKRAEYLTLWASSVPCCRDAWGQTVMSTLLSSGSNRKEASQELLSSLQLWNVWWESSLHPLWFFKSVFLAEKGNFCNFLPSLCLTALGLWSRKMCPWKTRSKALVHVVLLFWILSI